MKKALFLILLTVWTFLFFDALAQSWTFNCPTGNCLRDGVNRAGATIGQSSGVITGKSLSRAVQDIIIYFLTFLSLIAVIYVMWAGAQMLLFPASEESSEKTKKIIVSVIVGIAIIWFAWWIVSTLFFVLNNRQVLTNNWIPRAVAETQVRNVDFTTYSHKIRALKSKIIGWYSPEVTTELNVLVDGAYDHLPDRADKYVNKQLYDRVKKAISDYDLHREEIDRGILENAIDAFLEQSQTFSIQGTIAATPRDGDAPLSVTLEGKNIIDSSGTLIPDANYTWWVRTAEGPRVLGRGKTVNYVFEEEGTYTVYLTINSASRNSRNFVDVISFEDQVTVEVGQAKLKLVVFFNDQLATDNVKIPTRESTQKILIDATQTKFSSGYSILKTEWNFGNGNTIIREWPPIVEAQDYKEGEFTVKVTLTRNDGETFTRSILMKIGDPIAAISVNTLSPNKGDNVVFQAKKVSEEGVNYSWEIRRFGVEQPIFTTVGPRMEFTFREVGRYSVSLISLKGDARDKQSMEIDIQSRPPVVRFTADKLSQETPNIYIFDGTSTYDPDYPDNQGLKYQWFVNDRPTQLTETNSDNSRGKFTFPEVGDFQVELQVTDNEGKKSSFKKTINIKSLLSIQLNIRPQVVKRGENVLLIATAPNTTIYEWLIGARENVVTQSGRYATKFDAAGTYPLTLKVTDAAGNTNSIQRKIYVTDGDAPFWVIHMTTESLFTETQAGACNGKEAMIVDRVTPVYLVGDRSVNVGGKPDDLTYFWKVGLNASSTKRNFSHTFDELGCEKITLTVNDKKTGASHTAEEWVKVINIPPRFSDISVKVENIDQDPMRVDLQMLGAKDPDGVIRSYTWYYYTSTDEQPQGFRITTKPETSFTLPKINGRYHFSVVLEDANNLRVDTRDMSESRFSTPDLLVNQNISTPIIEFNANIRDIKYGDPVELSVTAKNALGQDITKAVEYRWDVDGDGFYDIKTSENVLTYKYTVPGEYHPKVKVTHRGLSTTKTLTVNVTNRLIPLAQMQIIGDKIIAYNTSTGIIQNVSWYADDVKISENKEYLLYTPPTATFPKNIRLEISEGSDTQSITLPVERNPQNKILVKKAGRPLVILTNQNDSVTAALDDVTWSDPVKPLFFYLGESEWAVQYYVIDNDVDIDTDLSGGKNDDADNKWTASYRLGRPYIVPMGTKRETIMRFRLLGTDGKEIDSRQIRVTRTFMAQEIDKGNITGVTPEKEWQPFNLSKEDKARLDRLSLLIKNIPDEVVKKDLSRFTDQLGDIWYDRADRAETLLQLSRSVDANSTITPDLKTRILEQINLIYTQWQQDAEERDLARTMLADFLSKNSGKKEIFWDGSVENPGLLGQIIENPEYYEQNKKLVDRIYEEFVRFDETLSEDAKSIIREKLTFLAGTPPAVEKPGENTITEENTGWFLSKFKNIGMILLWIALAVVGIFGMIFAGSRILAARKAKSQPTDTNHAGDGHGDDFPLTPTTPTPTADGTPDWLKNTESPFGSEDVLSQEVSQTQSSTETHTPDWMNDHHEEEKITPAAPIVAPVVEKPTPVQAPAQTADVPDWLKDETTKTPEVPSPLDTPVIPETPAVIPETPKAEAPEDDIPEWLRGSETEAPVTETPPAETPVTETIVEPVVEKEIIPETPVPTAPDEDDIPEWLKGTHEESSTPPATTEIPQKEETIEQTAPTETPVSTAWNTDTTGDTVGNTAQSKPMNKKSPKPKKVAGATKLLAEGDHLIGPATDLLGSPDNLIEPADNTPQP